MGSENQSSLAAVSCSICHEDVPLRDRAVLSPCMHAFCEGCIREWTMTHGKTSCPNCRGEAVSFFHDIQENGAYRECAIPGRREAQPEVARAPRPRLVTVAASVLQGRASLLQEYLEHVTPYEHWRVNVYLMKWRAEPPEDSASRPLYNSDQVRLERWLRREIHAMCGVQRNELVLMHVVSRVRAAGLLGGRRPSIDGLGELTAAEEQSIEDIRRSTSELSGHAEHFWHEIRSFQASGLGLRDYSNAVRYRNLAGDDMGSGASIQISQRNLLAEWVAEFRRAAEQRQRRLQQWRRIRRRPRAHREAFDVLE